MKCNQCGATFEGKFCPECGAKATINDPFSTSQYQQNNFNVEQKPIKKKKPFYLRWWFILIAVVAVIVIIIAVTGNGEKIVWDEIVMSNVLPEPPESRGEIAENSAEELRIEINKITDVQYADYIEECEENGFTIDADAESYSYSAYNDEGYKLTLTHFNDGEEMQIELDTPMEMSPIVWPSGSAGGQLPTPKSTTGKFSYENDDSFHVFIGNTTKADYNDYVNACSEKGFNIDYDKGENYYYADNSTGWSLSLRYEGFNIMSIDIGAPDGTQPTDSDETKAPETTTKETETQIINTTGIDPDFKAAMDSYENFMNDYVDFMKKFESNPDDLSILADYADYMSKYSDFVKDFENWEDEDLNNEEMAYYIDVQSRVTKKLLEISE